MVRTNTGRGIPRDPTPWHSLGQQEVCEKLGVDATLGLSRAEVEHRLAAHGPNEIQVKQGPSPWRIFLGQLKDPLIIILLVAASLSAAIGETFDAGLILGIVLFSAGLGFVQEYRAEKAVEALEKMLAPTARVLRDGKRAEAPVKELVPGDVVLLEAGDRVPADARVVESRSLKVDEASLTGESVPVDKRTATVAHDRLLPERYDMMFMGTAVVHGRGRAVVVATGMGTELGGIASAVGAAEEEKTPLERRTGEIGKWLGGLAVGVVLLVVVAGIARELAAGDSFTFGSLVTLFMFGVALAVAAVPEALAGIVTGTLAVGMRRMAARNALVRRLPAVEALGSVTVICSDKTGTITRGEMTVRKVYSNGGFLTVSGVGYAPTGDFNAPGSLEHTRPLLHAAAMCSDATLNQEDGVWSIQGDPTEGALVVAATKFGIDVRDLRAKYPRIDEVPFSSESKRMTTIHTTPDGKTVAFMKGAVEVVLARCHSELQDMTQVTLNNQRRASLLEIADGMAAEGLRVLAVARGGLDEREGDVESNMTLLGLVGMIDPAREESIQAAKTSREIGIRPVMITGDHKLTAMAVAKEVGIYREGDLAISGSELQELSEEELERIAADVSVYARVSPTDKLKIVDAWRRRGEVVAMTGDGVNDAPALKHADVGIAMGITGTEVSQEAADIVLADDNFATIVRAVAMGRWIYDNIKKYLTYLLRANFLEVLVIGGVVLVKGVDALPLLPSAILYINLVTDGLPAIALGFSPREPDLMHRPPRRPDERVFSRDVNAVILLSLLVAPIFFWVFLSQDSLLQARTDLFVLLVAGELAMALNLRSLRYSILTTPPHLSLVASVVGSIAITAIVLAVPAVRDSFGISIPTLDILWKAVGMMVLITAMSETVKLALRRLAPRTAGLAIERKS